MGFHRYGLQNVAYASENVWKCIEMHYSVHDMLWRVEQLLLSSEIHEIENVSFHKESCGEARFESTFGPLEGRDLNFEYAPRGSEKSK